MQRPRRRRLPGLAADEKGTRRFSAAAQQVAQVLVRAQQEKSLLLPTTERTFYLCPEAVSNSVNVKQ